MGALGLPQSAWQNAATYSATEFPTSAALGDRILRTDLTAGGIWYTYVDYAGASYWVPDAGTLVCKLSQGTAQDIPAAGTPTINFDTLSFNLVGGWVIGTPNRFKPNVPGWYSLSGSTSFSNHATGWRHARWQKNGLDFDGCGVLGPAASGIATTCLLPQVSVFLNGTTDYVWIMVQHTAGVLLTTDTTTPYRRPTLTALYSGL